MKACSIIYLVVVIAISFAACKKKENVAPVTTPATTDSIKSAAPQQVPFIFHPYTDTFYGQWNQTVYGTYPYVNGKGYSSLYVHYLNDSVLVFKSPSFGIVNRNMGI